MIPWVHMDTAAVTGVDDLEAHAARSRVFDHGGLLPADEQPHEQFRDRSFAELACRHRARRRRNCRVLIGGYGMGFTLRAALAGFGADATIVVAELVPAIIKWARGPMAALTAGCLDDPRVSFIAADFGSVIASAQAGFVSILLDVDNGPDALCRKANGKLYDASGLKTARKALRPKGMLAVWSAAPDPQFTNRLGRAGFTVEEIKARAHKGRGVRHVIWTAVN